MRVVRQMAATGSFTQAAELLGYTQSAVSRQVASMEAAAGAPIFERRRRGVALTATGEVLVRRATAILADMAATEQELAGLRDRLAGRLVVGACPTAAMALVPRAIARTKAAHPGLAVVLRLGLVAAGLGVTVIPDLAVPALPAGIRTASITDSRRPGRAGVAVTRVRPSVRAQALVSALADQAATHDAEPGTP